MLGDAIVEVSFADPLDPPEWVELNEYVNNWDFDRELSTITKRAGAGIANLELHNWEGQFTPNNTASPYYPNVLPMRRVRIMAQVDIGATPFQMGSSFLGAGDALGAGPYLIRLFTGFIEEWPQSWRSGGFDQIIRVRAVDGLEPIGLAPFVWGHRYRTLDPGPDDWPYGLPGGTNVTPDVGPPVIPNELTGKRAHRVLDAAGWPAADRVIDDGQVEIWGHDGGNTNIRVTSEGNTYLQDLAATEGGFAFIDRAGRVRFIDSANDPPLHEWDLWGDGDGELPYRAVRDVPFGVARIWNDITVTTTAENLTGSSTAKDATSQARYYPRPQSFTLLPVASTVLLARRTELLARYAHPFTEIVGFDPMPRDPFELVRILRKELADKIRVRLRPDGSDMLEQPSRLEGIRVQSPDQGTWRISWRTSALA